MLWLRLHPYTTAALITGFLLVFGAAVVIEHASVAPAGTSEPAAWASNDNGYFSAPATVNPNVADHTNDPLPLETRTANYISPFATTTGTLGSNTTDTPADLDTLLASLSHPTAQSAAAPGKVSYDFIPKGLISVSNLEIESPSLNDTTTQRELRDYGNAMGAAILNFESNHPDQATILKDHAEAPYDSGKVHALDQLGQDYVALGDSLGEIGSIPSQMQSAHKKLVADYRNLGAKLSAVSKSPGDLITAIEAYNASADQFAKDFVTFALLFPANGVKFMQAEAGSTFQFSGGGGL